MLASWNSQKYLQDSEWLGLKLVRLSPGGAKSVDIQGREKKFFAVERGIEPPEAPAKEADGPYSPVNECGSEEAKGVIADYLWPSLHLHFCGALASSPAGAATVAGGYLGSMLRNLREVKSPAQERSAADVTLGQIAAAEDHGFALAKKSGGLQDHIALAQSAGHFNLRASLMLSLSLYAQHVPSRDILQQAG